MCWATAYEVRITGLDRTALNWFLVIGKGFFAAGPDPIKNYGIEFDATLELTNQISKVAIFSLSDWSTLESKSTLEFYIGSGPGLRDGRVAGFCVNKIYN